MNHAALQSALRRHSQAWSLLQRAAADNGMAGCRFSGLVDIFSDAAKARDWLLRHRFQLPEELRPEADEVGFFANLLSSYFATSVRARVVHQVRFERDENVEVEHAWRIVSGTERSRGRSSNARRRLDERVRILRRAACADLLEEASWPRQGSDALVCALETDRELDADLNLLTYAHELLRRERFASQGEAVHLLWQRLPHETRTQLTAEIVWSARSRLLAALDRFAETLTAPKPARLPCHRN